MKDIFLKKELHLAIIWQKGRYKEREIIESISEKFELLEKYRINWHKKSFNKSLSTFYGTNLPINSKKEKHCGNGEFLLITFYDNKPKYGFVETSRGSENVNLNVFKLKSKCREITGGGHKVHTTNSPKETNHDLILLLGISYQDYEKLIVADPKKNNKKVNNVIETTSKQIIGLNGWDNLEQLFYVLNNTIDYVVLRNFEKLPYDIEGHDIDFLVRDLAQTIILINGSKVSNDKNNVCFKIKVANKNVLVDFRHVNDGYYDLNWQNNILDSKILNSNGIYIPSNENYFYSLIYHSLIHKYFITADKPQKIKSAFKNLPYYDEKKCNFDNYLSLLENFFKRNYFNYSEPKDPLVSFDKKYVNYKKYIYYLNDLNFKKISPYLVDEWKNSSKQIYFLAENDLEEKFIIKVGGIYDSVRREFRIIQELKTINKNYFPIVLFYRFTPNIKYLVMKKIEGDRLDFLIQSSTLKKKNDDYIKNLYNGIFVILSVLHKTRIIHRDIRPENLIVKKNGVPILIDFQFAVDIDRKIYKEYKIVLENPKYLATLGRDYKKNRFHWDDAYSFKKIIGDLDFIKDHEFFEIKKKVNKLVGKYEIISIRKNLFSKLIVLLKNQYRSLLNTIKRKLKKKINH